jgi:hypothetical protein
MSEIINLNHRQPGKIIPLNGGNKEVITKEKIKQQQETAKKEYQLAMNFIDAYNKIKKYADKPDNKAETGVEMQIGTMKVNGVVCKMIIGLYPVAEIKKEDGK